MSEQHDKTDAQNNPEATPIDDNQTQTQESVTIDIDSASVETLSPEQARIFELENELAAAKQALSDQKDGALRAVADGENAKRRAAAEIDKARKFALERFAGDLLPVIDNLENAIRFADRENEALKPILDGIDMTQKSFISTVEKNGLEVINPQGETFNPEHHQAMSMQESADVAPNTVLAVMQNGYIINGRLLRPAMVMVSKAPENNSPVVDTEA
ncbi:MAG: nucleotide exchange factor GrpE [Glaciecola sp.]|nr:nucleotide exchange factor GrpE [Glaciecola sp.]